MHLLLTGASSGIGRELSKLLSNDDSKLSLCGRNPNKLKTTLESLKPHASVYSKSFDLHDVHKTEAFINAAVETHGEVDVLINCAGHNTMRGWGHEADLATLGEMMDINFYAPLRFMQACIPNMVARKSGTVINILSTTCLFSNPNIAAYTATKAALDSYTKVMRKELTPEGVKILSVYPGGVDSDFREADRPEYLCPESVAKAIVSLLDSDSNTHIHELVIRPTCENNYP